MPIYRDASKVGPGPIVDLVYTASGESYKQYHKRQHLPVANLKCLTTSLVRGDEREVGVNKNRNGMASAEIIFIFIPSVAQQEYIFSVLSPQQFCDRDT